MANEAIPSDVLSNINNSSSGTPFRNEQGATFDDEISFLDSPDSSSGVEEETSNNVSLDNNSVQANIIKSLQVKKARGFYAPVFLGTDPYLVGAIRGTSLNNLEEEMILGMDCITTSWEENNGTKKSIKEFRREDIHQNYYRIESSFYPSDGPTPGEDETSPVQLLDGEWQFVVSDEKIDQLNDQITLLSPNYSTEEDDLVWAKSHGGGGSTPTIEEAFIVDEQDSSYENRVLTINNADNYSINESKEELDKVISPAQGGIIEEHLLYFVNANGQNILISKKEVLQSLDNLDRIITKEVITNYLE